MRAQPRQLAILGVALMLGALLAACSGGSSRSKAPTLPQSGSSASSTATAPSTSATGATESVVPGDIPDNQAFVPFTGNGFSVETPEGWARSAVTGGVVFSDHFNSEEIVATSSSTPPTVASVQATTVPALQRSLPGFVLRGVTTVTRPAGPVVLTTYAANSAPDPVTNKRVALDVERYDYWRGGT